MQDLQPIVHPRMRSIVPLSVSDRGSGLSEDRVKNISDLCRDKKISFQSKGQNPALILIGEAHEMATYLAHQQIESAIINIARPEFILHEFLRGDVLDPSKLAQRYLQRNRTMVAEDLTMRPDFPNTIVVKAASEIGALIIGCDLSFGEHAQVEQSFPEVEGEDWCSELLMPHRDRKMEDLIIRYSNQSSFPIVACLGIDHVNNIVKSNTFNRAIPSFLVVICQDLEDK